MQVGHPAVRCLQEGLHELVWSHLKRYPGRQNAPVYLILGVGGIEEPKVPLRLIGAVLQTVRAVDTF